MKKLLSLVLSLIMVLSVVPAFAFSVAAESEVSDLTRDCEHSFTNYVNVDVDYMCKEDCPNRTEENPTGYIAQVADCDKGCGSVSFICEGEENLIVTKEAVEPTCIEKGATAEKVCPDCNQVIIPSQSIPANGHTYGETDIIEDSDFFNEGVGVKTCTVEGCGYEKEVVIPIKTFGETTVAIIGDYENPQTFDSLFGDGSAYEAAEEGDVIILVKDVKLTETATIDKDIVIDLVGHTLTSSVSTPLTADADITFRSTATGLDAEEKSETKGKIKFSTTLVKGSAVTTFDNIEATASANVSIFTPDSSGDAELVIKDSKFTVSNTGTKMAPLTFTSGIVKVDVEDSTLQSGTNGEGIYFNSTGVTGTFKNVIFYKQSNSAVTVTKTGTDGIVFDGCTFKQWGWDNVTVFYMTGGTATLTGGSVVDGDNRPNVVLSVTGGNLTIDGATIKGNKPDSGRYLTSITATKGVDIKKAAFIKGYKTSGSTKIYNGSFYSTANAAKFWNAIADECAVYSVADTTSGEYAFEFESDVTSNNMIYVNACAHDEIETDIAGATVCTSSSSCKHCGGVWEAYQHIGESGEAYDGYGFDENGHWKACSICGEKDPNNSKVEDHKGGTASCGSKAICEVCGNGYGSALEHKFLTEEEIEEKNTQAFEKNMEILELWVSLEDEELTEDEIADISAQIEEKEAELQEFMDSYIGYDEESHWYICQNEGCTEKSGEAEHSGEAMCGSKAICDECGQEFGEVLEHNFAEYVYDENAGCTTDGTETAECENGCGETDTRYISGSKLGHSWVVSKGYAATCSSPGLTDGSYCERCSQVREEQEVIPISKNAHIWDQGVITVEGDCSTDCIYTYTCTLCKTTATHNFGKVSNKHTYSNAYTLDSVATYFADGSKAKYCIKCKKAKTSVTSIPMLTLGKVTLAKAYKKAKKKVTIKFGAVSGATGYEVYIQKNGKWKKYKTTTKLKMVIKKLTAGKKYKVKVRAYVQSGSNIKYGAFSKVKTVKCKGKAKK